NDAAFVEAVASHGKVVVGARYIQMHVGQSVVNKPLEPFPELQRVAPWGITEAHEVDRPVRELYRPRQTNVAGFAWRTLELAQPKDLPDPNSVRYLNYYGPSQTIIPSHRYVDVLSNQVPQLALSNRVVFVGALAS